MKTVRKPSLRPAENCAALLIHDYQGMAENCACSGLFCENTADLNQIDSRSGENRVLA